MARRKIPYQEGDLFAVPLETGGYALGLLAEHNRAQEALLEFEALSKHDLDDEMAQEVKDSVERLKRKMSRQ